MKLNQMLQVLIIELESYVFSMLKNFTADNMYQCLIWNISDQAKLGLTS